MYSAELMYSFRVGEMHDWSYIIVYLQLCLHRLGVLVRFLMS